MAKEVKFLLYNIRYGTGAGVGYHLPLPFTGYFLPSLKNTERIVRFIKQEHPDIIGLVEVDEGSYRSGRTNQAKWIAQELGYSHVYESKYGEESMVRRMPVLKSQGNAFITNQAIMARHFHFFKTGIKKLVIELEFDTFVIFLVHLSLKFRHRQRQLGDLHRLSGDAGQAMAFYAKARRDPARAPEAPEGEAEVDEPAEIETVATEPASATPS